MTGIKVFAWLAFGFILYLILSNFTGIELFGSDHTMEICAVKGS